MSLLTLGLSHHTAPVEARGRLAFIDAELPAALARLKGLPGIREAAILSTCNRTEIFAVAEADDESRLTEWWRRERQAEPGLIEQHRFIHRETHAVLHALRVAAGLDSLVVGEPQILGQMKQAYATAQREGTLGPVLTRLFQHTFAVAKKVRSDTEIGAHPVSAAYAAVQIAKRIFADFSRQTALLIGAGDTIHLFARHLRGQGIGRMIVANRSLENAQKLAQEIGAYAVTLDDLPTHLADADLVVSSTAARSLIVSRTLMESALTKRRRKPVFLIDLAVPADLDPKIRELEDCYLYTVDDLRSVIAENLKARESAAEQAEELLHAHAREFLRWLESRDVAPTIQALRGQARDHRDAVLDKARHKLATGESPEIVMQFVADTLTNKLLHAPSAALKRADAVEQALLLSAAQSLFGLGDAQAGTETVSEKRER
jgi:glutamyl-tRNA reductase